MKLTKCLFLILFLTATGLSADDAVDANTEYQRLLQSGSEDAEVWFNLAVRARGENSLDIADSALDKAGELQLSPVRVGIERSRIRVAAGDLAKAIKELQDLFAAGFTSVSALTGDPVINSLAGQSDYDALIAEMTVQAFPCEHQEKFREFDFWIGEWDVHIANGTFAGKNEIVRAERGCVLIENWSGASGGTGMSINYLDKATNEWVQIWNAAGGTQITIRGGMTEEGMLLVGEIHYVGNGTTAPFRGLWTPMPDGRVRQFFEQSNDGGETWVPWFEGFYTRTM